MPRVHEIAKELGISSKEALARLEGLGAPAKSHSSSIDDATSERLRADVRGDGAGPSEASATAKDAAAEERAEPSGAEAGEPASGEEPRGAEAGATSTETASPPATETKPAAAEGAPSAPPAAKPAKGETGPATKPPKRVKRRSPVRKLLGTLSELPLLILFAFVIAVLIKTFLAQAFFIPSGSMLPTLQVGDRVLVEKISYRFGHPDRSDVVVFGRSVFGPKTPDQPWTEDVRSFVRELLGLPTGQEQDYIKRVVAVGGDSIRYEGKPRVLYVNGKRVKEPYLKGTDRFSPTLTSADCESLKMDQSEDGGCRVPAGRVFVMGDNRSNSEDSRAIGPINESKIVGRAFAVIWPPGDFGGL